jgi:uncharacterized protein YkwD
MEWLKAHKKLAILAVVIVGYLIYCAIYTAFETPVTPKTTPVVAKEQISTAAIYNEVNAARHAAGVQVLSLNTLATKAAEARCQDMVTKDYYDHVNPTTGEEWYKTVERLVPGGLLYNENIIEGGGLKNQDYVNSWLNSPGHKATMLEPRFTDTGLAICHRKSQPADSLLIVQEFVQMPEKSTL